VFPVPRVLTVTRKCVVLPDEVDQVEPSGTVQLHQLIRDEKCPLCEPICAMDTRIKADPTGLSIDDDQLKEYKRQISEAQKHVLTNADVILCTCAESASKRVRKATNIQQVRHSRHLPVHEIRHKHLFVKHSTVQ